MSNYTPMRVAESDVFTVNFAPLPPGVTIVSAVWSISVVSGDDPAASSMIVGGASINGTEVSQLIKGNAPGVTYAPICTALLSDGRTRILPDPGTGYLYTPA